MKHKAAKTITRWLVNIQRSIENREYHTVIAMLRMGRKVYDGSFAPKCPTVASMRFGHPYRKGTILKDNISVLSSPQ